MLHFHCPSKQLCCIGGSVSNPFSWDEYSRRPHRLWWVQTLNSKITTAYYWIYVSTDINECASSPCQNGGTCSDLVNSYTCNCAGGFTGGNCQTSKLSVNSYLTSVYLLYLINNSSHSYTCKTLLILF